MCSDSNINMLAVTSKLMVNLTEDSQTLGASVAPVSLVEPQWALQKYIINAIICPDTLLE